MRRRSLFSLFALCAGLCWGLPSAVHAAQPDLCFGELSTIQGGAGDDRLVGTPEPDIIVGHSGADTIIGKGGDDLLCGYRGTDVILGGRGRDRISGDKEQDTVDGGRGDDTLIGGSNGYCDIPGGDTVSYSQASGPVTVDLTAGTASGRGTDSISGFGEIVGSSYGDTLTGGGAFCGNALYGRGGNDTIQASQLELNDLVDGGRGRDTLYGGNGYDTVDGGSGADTLYGGPQDDSVLAQDGVSGNDTADGGADNDTCTADSGDTLSNCES